jgi:hypothetical protein
MDFTHFAASSQKNSHPLCGRESGETWKGSVKVRPKRLDCLDSMG